MDPSLFSTGITGRARTTQLDLDLFHLGNNGSSLGCPTAGSMAKVILVQPYYRNKLNWEG
jgi:hypothetical protein